MSENESNEFQIIDEQPSAMVAVESNKQIAQIQAQIISAKRFPRDTNLVYTKLMKLCQRKTLADVAIYKYTKGKAITGPSIHLAVAVAQTYTNLDFGTTILDTKADSTLMQAYCYDLENNVRSQRTFTVPHKMKSGDVYKNLVDPRDQRDYANNIGSRNLRACIIHMIPKDLMDAAERQCKATLTGDLKESLESKIERMVFAFDSLGVSKEMLEQYLEHGVELTNVDEIFDLVTIYNSLKDGQSKREDFFKFTKTEPTVEELEVVAKLDEFTEAEPEQINFVATAAPSKPAN